MQPVSAASWTVGMLCIHAAIIRNCGRFLAEPASLTATRKWRTRFVFADQQIEPAFTPVISICMELPLASGFVDNL